MADVASLYSYKNKLLPLAGTYFCFRNNIDSKWLGGCCCLVTKSYLTLCAPMGCSTPGFPVLHCLLELAQSHDHWVDDAIQPSHPLSPPSPALNLSQHQGLFQWMSQLFASSGQSIGASASASVLPMNIQGWFHLGLTDLISLQSKGLSRIFFSTIISPKFHAAYRKTEVTRSQIRYYVVEPEWDSSPLDFKVHDLSIRLICPHKGSGLLIKLLPHPS